MSKAHYHLKTHALKRRAENRAVFDQVKLVFSYNTNENFLLKYITNFSFRP